MAVNSSEESHNVHSVVVVLPDGGATNLQCELVQNVCSVEVPNVMKNEICLNTESSLLNHTNLKVDKAQKNAPCNLDVDIEKGKTQIPKSNEESIGHLKCDDSFARSLQWEIFLQFGGKLMQFLMNHIPELPKVTSKDRYTAERVYDVPANRSRKYKRSPSFNSRRVVLLFSVM
ncbi:hypothetical protein Sango_2806900 [Sesamum angolense]|uniref:Uncharacterized protein n=1 Tax=Sesamum angolense TaxID=2727404 RepID=A0AAE1T8N7_9LAMI|nr:hypothetical protein Sango_2806900 [Sesamum angolense]